MPNKELGQHWLTDRQILANIADAAKIKPDDTVLEIGPGLGTLTSELLKRAAKVVAVEFDAQLASKLQGQFPGKNLVVNHQDILKFNLNNMPTDYLVVANVPYYITSKIVKMLLTSKNPPKTIVLLVQREVAERIAAKPGDMSLLSLSAQIYSRVSLGIEVQAKYFTPPPKVDSQVVVLERLAQPVVNDEDLSAFWRLAHAGFSSKRKKLRSSIAAGLHISKPSAEELLRHANINPDARAQDLKIDDWARLAIDGVG